MTKVQFLAEMLTLDARHAQAQREIERSYVAYAEALLTGDSGTDVAAAYKRRASAHRAMAFALDEIAKWTDDYGKVTP